MRQQNTIDVERARKETPACLNVIHFNNAGASLMPEPVLNAMLDHLTLEAEIGGYEAFELRLEKTERLYDAAALLFGCDRSEIAFVENATRAWDMAFYSLTKTFKKGDKILTGNSEYASNFIPFLQVAKELGIRIEVVPDDEHGQISIEALRSAVDERTSLIAITHAPSTGGLINPAAEIGQIARDAGIPYLLDACQTAGQVPLDVKNIGCTMLSTTGRKFLRGPRATGLLYVSKEWIEQLDPVFLDLHAATWTATNDYSVRQDARRFENWEQNYAGKIGLAVAIDYAIGWGVEAIRTRVSKLAEMLRQQLAGIPEIKVHDTGKQKSGIVTFAAHGKDAQSIKEFFSTQSVNVSIAKKSYTLLDLQARNLEELIRASVHYYNTENEIDRFCKLLHQFCSSHKLR